jgi:hypothetical protein
MFFQHVEASLRGDRLLESCQRLMAAGRRAAARRALSEAEQLQELLTALERAVNRAPAWVAPLAASARRSGRR